LSFSVSLTIVYNNELDDVLASWYCWLWLHVFRWLINSLFTILLPITSRYSKNMGLWFIVCFSTPKTAVQPYSSFIDKMPM
jgi:hypothetical protein